MKWNQIFPETLVAPYYHASSPGGLNGIKRRWALVMADRDGTSLRVVSVSKNNEMRREAVNINLKKISNIK